MELRLALLALAASVIALPGCAPLVVGGAAAGVAVAHDRRSSTTVLEDKALELSINNRINGDPSFADGSHINVAAYNHVVLITGEVPTREIGLRVGELVRGTDKVRQVHNELVIAEPSSVANRANDSLISTGVKSSLLAVDRPGFDPTRVKVITENGIVYLLGLVTLEEADDATDRARRVSGVRKVVRLFEILPPPR